MHWIVLVFGDDVDAQMEPFLDGSAPEGESGQCDSWQVGGRWKGALFLKNGALADSAPMGEIDWLKTPDLTVCAAIIDGEWVSGPSNYFGSDMGTPAMREHQARLRAHTDAIADDVRLTIVDCHG